MIHAANLEMRDISIKATLQPESEEMYQHTQEQRTAALPRDHLMGKPAQALKLLIHMSISFVIYGVTVHILLQSVSVGSIHIQHLISALAFKHSF